jgi:hypothetical protein
MPDKPREHYYLQALRRALTEVPPGEPVCPEPPDFVIAGHNRRLGIEFIRSPFASSVWGQAASGASGSQRSNRRASSTYAS